MFINKNKNNQKNKKVKQTPLALYYRTCIYIFLHWMIEKKNEYFLISSAYNVISNKIEYACSAECVT